MARKINFMWDIEKVKKKYLEIWREFLFIYANTKTLKFY